VARVVGDAGARLRERGALRIADQVVQRALLFRKASVDGERGA
jgi:hypothetical protein